ncbi:MAG: sulfatase [Pirellulales bacterium]|nr:sulfatase [Pirellulales bacterium]
MKRLFCTAAIVIAACLLASSQASAANAKRPNVIFLLVDDWGWTDGGCFGSDLYETPNIDRLVSQGMKFTDGYAACTVCSPTRAAVMTGKYPARLRVTDFIAGHARPKAKLKIPDWTKYLPHTEVTIAEALKSAGYSTIHLGKWHLTKPNPEEIAEGLPTKHGFDVNIGGGRWGLPGSYFHPFHRGRGRAVPFLPRDTKQGDYLTDILTREATKQIAKSKDAPFYMYFPYYNVHTPIQGKAAYVEKYRKKIAAADKPLRHTNATYAAMVQSVDESVGRLMQELETHGIADNTVIFLTGDNGGLLRNITRNTPLRAGKGSTYEGGVRVPTVVKWPGVTKPGSVSHEPVISPDYYPTILDMCGATGDAAHNKNVDGLSLTRVLKDSGAKLNRNAIYWHYPHYHPGGSTPYSAIRARDWKLIEFFEDNRAELYNLKDDIGEKNNLAKSNPQKAKELRDQLHAWRKSVGAQLPTPNPDHNPNAAPKSKRKTKKTGA